MKLGGKKIRKRKYCPQNVIQTISESFSELWWCLVAQQLYMSSCTSVFFCLSHPSTYELTSPQTNLQVYMQTHKTLLNLIWINVLRNSCTVTYWLSLIPAYNWIFFFKWNDLNLFSNVNILFAVKMKYNVFDFERVAAQQKIYSGI